VKIRELLAKYKTGEISVEQVENLLIELGLVCGAAADVLPVGRTGRLDPGRAARCGVPEAIFAEGKQPREIVEFLRALAVKTGCALATRITTDAAALCKAEMEGEFELDSNERARTMVVKRTGYVSDRIGRSVGILAAGTCDLPVAEEARVAAEVMGCDVIMACDVGVAGIHRLFGPLREMRGRDVDAIIVVAGMEGALPTVVKALVSVPVIGVPTSTGYGYGGKGEGALMTMLQSCSPGLTVVNIDNGFGAAAAAVLTARRAASAASSLRAEGPRGQVSTRV